MGSNFLVCLGPPVERLEFGYQLFSNEAQPKALSCRGQPEAPKPTLDGNAVKSPGFPGTVLHR